VVELALYPGAGHGYARQGGGNAARTLDLLKSFVERQLRAQSQGW
jgi:hypothetical protein